MALLLPLFSIMIIPIKVIIPNIPPTTIPLIYNSSNLSVSFFNFKVKYRTIITKNAPVNIIKICFKKFNLSYLLKIKLIRPNKDVILNNHIIL